MFTCTATPYRLAFSKDKRTWIYVDSVVDSFFGVDIIVNFFTAYYDMEYMLVDDKKVIL
jgi:hypothetical protein